MLMQLMRHGATGQPSYRSRLDDALSDLGWQQSRAATQAGRWDIVFSSTLRRCADFARELSSARAIPLQLDDRLVEYDFGAWQGRRIEDLEREEAAALARYRADPQRHPPPGGEDFAAFTARVAAALDAAAHCAALRVLVLTHGAVIRWVQCHLAGLPLAALAETGIANASLHQVAWPVPAAAGKIAGLPPWPMGGVPPLPRQTTAAIAAANENDANTPA